MSSKLEMFACEIADACQGKVLTIATLGSRHGENDLSLSDIDLLVLCKNKADIPSVFETSLKLKEKIFHLSPAKSTRWMQQFLLASNRYNGIHLIILGMDEFDEDFQPTSFRLRLLTKIM